jgi:serine protease Do
MIMTRLTLCLLLTAGVFLAPANASDPFTKIVEDVNTKTVKLFGSGGFRGVVNYGTGIIVSPDGHILTIASQLLDTSELIVHLYDGRRMKALVVAMEPDLDIALIRIKIEGKKADEPTGLNLPYFDIPEALKRPLAAPGDWVLSFANQFEIAMRDEPVSVQRGVVAAYSKLSGRRGIFDFPYTGFVYVIDAITNNPGAGGGALTDRQGRLLGIVGRELKNTQTETWLNYAVPIGASVEVRDGEKLTKVSIPEFLDKAKLGQYKTRPRSTTTVGPGAYHGIVFVPNILDRTPPYIDECEPNSPAAKAGLQPNDLVSFLDGEPIGNIRVFVEAVKKTRPGQTVKLEIRRGDKLQSFDLKLEDFPKPAAKKP